MMEKASLSLLLNTAAWVESQGGGLSLLNVLRLRYRLCVGIKCREILDFGIVWRGCDREKLTAQMMTKFHLFLNRALIQEEHTYKQMLNQCSRGSMYTSF